MYTGIFRTCREKHNLIKILTFNKINNIILAFYDELLKHPFGCFCFGEINFKGRTYFFYVIARSYRGPRGILSTRGEKEHTSKRVSVIASDNVISKAKLCDAYTGIFRTCREKHNLIKILTFNKINNIILAFYDELLKHPFGCFCFGKNIFNLIISYTFV